MAERRSLVLTDAQRETLEEGRDHHPRPAIRERCAALLKIAQGQSPHWIAQHGLLRERDPDTVYAWLSRYHREGLAGILGHRQGGYHGRRL
jgi:hypothetical protein